MSPKAKSESGARRKPNRAAGPDDWEAWSAHLAGRKKPAHPADVIPGGKTWPLRWVPSEGFADSESERLVAQLERWVRDGKTPVAEVVDLLEPWLAAAGSRTADAGFGLECLAWSYSLPSLARVLPAAPWTQALERLAGLAREANSAPPSDDVLAEQLLAAELPLTLSHLFPELPICHELGEPARKRLVAGIHDLLDGDGFPRSRHLPVLRDLLACWTRSRYLARVGGRRNLNRDERLMFEWLVRRTLQLTRNDGSAVFSDGSKDGEFPALIDAALTLTGDQEDVAIADQVLPGHKEARKKSGRKTLFPDASANSEWAEIGVLRPDWMRGGEHLVVTFNDRAIRSELNCGSTTVWSGDWTPQLVIDGQRLEPSVGWEQNCWFSDDDVDYLELTTTLQDGWRIERQMIMAREERFLFVADAILGEGPGEIEYCSRLPLTAGVDFRAAEESHEGFLASNKRLALVLPLAFPEWRSEHTDGALQAVEGGLQLSIRRRAQRLYAPLFLDLNRKRARKEATWRHLTVAEQLEIQPTSSAVGYRVQVDTEQWLFYRSLSAPASRTLLGQNLAHEFFAARFDVDGEADEMIGIDPTE